MPIYRVYCWCEECKIGYPTDVLTAPPEPNLAGRSIEEIYADREMPANVKELLKPRDYRLPQGTQKREPHSARFFPAQSSVSFRYFSIGIIA
jgi:hypothetical protein